MNNIADLLAENKRWRAENQQLRFEKAALEKRVARLETELQALKELLENTQRRGKRQATPFSKGEPKAAPQTPGRKAGHASRAAHRAVPDKVDRTEEAPMPPACPDCGGQVVEDDVQTQDQIDIPRLIPVSVTQFNIHVGHCQICGQRLQGRQAEQTSDATGAAAVQIGPNALGLAAELKHVLGVPFGKVARTPWGVSTATDLELNRSTLARASQRLARKCWPTYARLILRLRQGAVTHVDETGWKVGGHSAWLWVFTHDDISLYVIDPSRAHEVVEDTRSVGTEYAGVLVSDCFMAYDPLTCAQSKCVGHLLRHCKELQEIKSGRAVQFTRDLAHLLRAATTLKARRQKLSGHGYTGTICGAGACQVACGRLEAAPWRPWPWRR